MFLRLSFLLALFIPLSALRAEDKKPLSSTEAKKAFLNLLDRGRPGSHPPIIPTSKRFTCSS